MHLNAEERLPWHSLGLTEPAQVREARDLVLPLWKLLFWQLSSNLCLKEMRSLVRSYTTSPDKSCARKSSLWTCRGNSLFLLVTCQLLIFLPPRLKTRVRVQTPKGERPCVDNEQSLPSVGKANGGRAHWHSLSRQLQVHARVFSTAQVNLIEVLKGCKHVVLTAESYDSLPGHHGQCSVHFGPRQLYPVQ